MQYFEGSQYFPHQKITQTNPITNFNLPLRQGLSTNFASNLARAVLSGLQFSGYHAAVGDFP
jgi:hypothetical protein